MDRSAQLNIIKVLHKTTTNGYVEPNQHSYSYRTFNDNISLSVMQYEREVSIKCPKIYRSLPSFSANMPLMYLS